MRSYPPSALASVWCYSSSGLPARCGRRAVDSGGDHRPGSPLRLAGLLLGRLRAALARRRTRILRRGGVAVDLTLVEVSADRITAMQAERLDRLRDHHRPLDTSSPRRAPTSFRCWRRRIGWGRRDRWSTRDRFHRRPGRQDRLLCKAPRPASPLLAICARRGRVVALRCGQPIDMSSGDAGVACRRPGGPAVTSAVAGTNARENDFVSSADRYYGAARADRRPRRLPTAVHSRVWKRSQESSAPTSARSRRSSRTLGRGIAIMAESNGTRVTEDWASLRC